MNEAVDLSNLKAWKKYVLVLHADIRYRQEVVVSNLKVHMNTPIELSYFTYETEDSDYAGLKMYPSCYGKHWHLEELNRQ